MRRPRLLAALSLVVLVLSGCAKAKVEKEAAEKAAEIIPIPDTDRARVHLTPEAVRRLDLQTGTIHDEMVAARAPAAPVAADVGGGGGGEGPPTATPVTPPTTAAPVPVPPPEMHRVIPFAAVLYAPTGDAFTYVHVEPGLYERMPIGVDYVVGELAVLSSGPPSGTTVVTVSGPELSGAEFGVGE